MASPTPVTYFSGSTTVGTTPTSLYTLFLAYFVANRPADLNPAGNLWFSAYRLVNIVVTGGAAMQYGDYTTTTTIGIPVGIGASKYEQDYTGRPSIDLTTHYVCAAAGTCNFSFECWR